jgi:hypothetical protein
MILNAQPARFNFVFFAKMSGATTPHSDFSVDKKCRIFSRAAAVAIS